MLSKLRYRELDILQTRDCGIPRGGWELGSSSPLLMARRGRGLGNVKVNSTRTTHQPVLSDSLSYLSYTFPVTIAYTSCSYMQYRPAKMALT